MGEYVVKASPDQDLYLIWSTEADSPHYVGTRFEIWELLWSAFTADHPHCRPERGWSPDDSLERADSFGSSAMRPPGPYGWEDDEFVVRDADLDGVWTVARSDLVAYAQALVAEDEAAAHALLKPIETEA